MARITKLMVCALILLSSLTAGEEHTNSKAAVLNGPQAGATAVVGQAVCGNFVLETAEECDDGNTLDGDGCDQYCHREDSFSTSTSPCYCPAPLSVQSDDFTPPAATINAQLVGNNVLNIRISYPYVAGGFFAIGADNMDPREHILPDDLPPSAVKLSSIPSGATPWDPTGNQGICTNHNYFNVLDSPWKQSISAGCQYVAELPVDLWGNLKVLTHRDGRAAFSITPQGTNITLEAKLHACFLQSVDDDAVPSLAAWYSASCQRSTIQAQFSMKVDISTGSFLSTTTQTSISTEGNLLLFVTIDDGATPQGSQWQFDTKVTPTIKNTTLPFTTRFIPATSDQPSVLVITSSERRLLYSFEASVVCGVTSPITKQTSLITLSIAAVSINYAVSLNFTELTFTELVLGSDNGGLSGGLPVPAYGANDWMMVVLGLPADISVLSYTVQLTPSATGQSAVVLFSDSVVKAPASAQFQLISDVELAKVNATLGFKFLPANATSAPGTFTLLVRIQFVRKSIISKLTTAAFSQASDGSLEYTKPVTVSAGASEVAKEKARLAALASPSPSPSPYSPNYGPDGGASPSPGAPIQPIVVEREAPASSSVEWYAYGVPLIIGFVLAVIGAVVFYVCCYRKSVHTDPATEDPFHDIEIVYGLPEMPKINTPELAYAQVFTY